MFSKKHFWSILLSRFPFHSSIEYTYRDLQLNLCVFSEDIMKRFNLSIILLSLLFVTGCNQSTPLDQEPLGQTLHPEINHLISPKVIPDRYLLEPITEINLEAKSAILISAQNGDIFFDKNSRESLGVASMSKIMSELLILEAIEKGVMDWDDSVTISDYAYTISHQPGFASIKLEQDQLYSVRELFHGMAITSANGATIALAEAVAGSEKEFVTLMNEKAKRLGLEDTHFVNSTGLTNHDLQNYHHTGSVDDYNKMSASDLATLTRYIIDNYPDLLEVTNVTEFDVQGETFENSNWMLPGATGNFVDIDVTFEGVDGLKTGFTSDAGYGFTGTVQIGESRFISVVIGTETIEERFIETGKLYEAISEQLND